MQNILVHNTKILSPNFFLKVDYDPQRPHIFIQVGWLSNLFSSTRIFDHQVIEIHPSRLFKQSIYNYKNINLITKFSFLGLMELMMSVCLCTCSFW